MMNGQMSIKLIIHNTKFQLTTKNGVPYTNSGYNMKQTGNYFKFYYSRISRILQARGMTRPHFWLYNDRPEKT